MEVYWVFLFFVTLATGWCLGYLAKKKKLSAQKNHLQRDYLVGLNYLLNEEPDKAVDVFVKMLEVDSETVETHLALAKLFRKRGEVDRAIRIHQNLIARPQLNKDYREQSLFELGQDYLSAGMLDRAERIFREALSIRSFSVPALRALLDIYQQEKDWENAIQTAYQLESLTKTSMQPVIAHYYCELAELAHKKGQVEQAMQYLKHALNADQRCVRANLILARFHTAKEDYRIALQRLKAIKEQNPEYLSEAIELIVLCYQAMNEENHLTHYLTEIVKDYPRTPVALILSEQIRRWKGDSAAFEVMADYIKTYPSIRGIHLLVALCAEKGDQDNTDALSILQAVTEKLLLNKPDYQCVSCGFSVRKLDWFCPSCKQWGTIKPIHCLEG